jgi:CubicO group peptidase (beta-lactamase class C family)
MNNSITTLLITAIMIGGVTRKRVNVDTSRIAVNQGDSISNIVSKASRTYRDRKATEGLSIGIFVDGKTFYYNYGTMDKENAVSSNSNTIYPIASISKTFVGILLAQAVLDKKVKLDDDIRKYLRGNYPNLEYGGHPITLVQLTNHRSGLPFILPERPETMPGYSGDTIPWPTHMAEIYKTYTRKDFYRDLHHVKLDTIPGFKFIYSNAAVQLLGYILEGVYHQPLEKLLREKITGPLKMNSTRIVLSGADSSRLAKGYDDKGQQMPYTPDQLQGAAAIKSTAHDVLLYGRWNAIEKDEAVKLSHKILIKVNDSYAAALNWQIHTTPGYRTIWEEGNIQGFNSYCVCYPELRMSIVVLTNESDRNSSPMLSKMISAIATSLDKRSPEVF